VLAHPIQLRYTEDSQLEAIVKELIGMGLGGIEIIHSDHDEQLVEQYTELADRYGLIKTGGSDFHGTNKKDIELGRANGRRVPRELFENLRQHLTTSAGIRA
jgi:predicted metal-dependent phosphoesterase TrpH